MILIGRGSSLQCFGDAVPITSLMSSLKTGVKLGILPEILNSCSMKWWYWSVVIDLHFASRSSMILSILPSKNSLKSSASTDKGHISGKGESCFLNSRLLNIENSFIVLLVFLNHHLEIISLCCFDHVWDISTLIVESPPWIFTLFLYSFPFFLMS